MRNKDTGSVSGLGFQFSLSGFYHFNPNFSDNNPILIDIKIIYCQIVAV